MWSPMENIPWQGLSDKRLDICDILGSDCLWVPALDEFPFILVFRHIYFCFCEILCLSFGLHWDVQPFSLTWKPETVVRESASLGSCPVLSANLAHPGPGNRVCWTILVCDHVPLADPSGILQACPHDGSLGLLVAEWVDAMLETGTYLSVQMNQSSWQTSDQWWKRHQINDEKHI